MRKYLTEYWQWYNKLPHHYRIPMMLLMISPLFIHPIMLIYIMVLLLSKINYE